MKSETPVHNSGKTRFNREKKTGESWISLREKAIKAGTFSFSPKNKVNFTKTAN